MALGIAVTLLAGVLIGQATAFYYSALGIVVGSLAFVGAARRNLREIMDHTDYYFYASF